MKRDASQSRRRRRLSMLLCKVKQMVEEEKGGEVEVISDVWVRWR